MTLSTASFASRMFVTLVAATTLVACTEGVSVSGTETPGVISQNTADQPAPLSVNDPSNTLTEPFVRPWIRASRSSVESSADADASGRCRLMTQDASDAFATSAFRRSSTTSGDPFFLATRPVSRDTPEYVEFCVGTNEPGIYRVFADIQAPSVFEDSFFVTVNETQAGDDAQPGIFDLPATSGTAFRSAPVKTRMINPLLLDLDAGLLRVRFYYREPNAGIKSITLVRQDSDNEPEPPMLSELAQCAVNTGLTEASISSLLDQYLGDKPRNFVLQPAEINTGTVERNDWKWNINGERGTVMCLSDPGLLRTNLVDNSITSDRIVFGSQGVDEQRAPTVLSGTFIGNGGNDLVAIVRDGTFAGGEGNDQVAVLEGGFVSGDAGADTVESMLDGVFSGGDGDDSVSVMSAGRFDGGEGDDRINQQLGGFFDGGPGPDSVTEQAGDATTENVETIGGVFDRFAGPENLIVVEASVDRALLRWSPSTDERTDGYEVRAIPDFEVERADFGVKIGRESQFFTTTRPFAVLNQFRPSDTLTVRAFSRQSDGSVLYSAAALVEFATPSTQELLADRTVLSSTTNNNAADDAGRAPDGTIVVATSRFGFSNGGELFTRYNSQLQSPENLAFDELIPAQFLLPAPGVTRQYVSYVPPNDQREAGSENALAAFDSNAENLLWTLNEPRAYCAFPFVTRDDWFICIDLDFRTREVSAFIVSPDGDSQVQLLPGLDFFTSLVTGDNATAVIIDSDRTQPLETMRVLDLVNGELRELTLSFSDQLEAGQRAVARGLAVKGKTAVITGGIFDDVCRTQGGACFREPQYAETIGYFLARVNIDTGEVLDYRPYALEERPSDGVGQFIGNTVVFSGSQPLTVHSLDTLESMERVFVPGNVADVNESTILTLEKDLLRDLSSTDLYLLAR